MALALGAAEWLGDNETAHYAYSVAACWFFSATVIMVVAVAL